MTNSILIIALISVVLGIAIFWREFEERQDKVPWTVLLGVLMSGAVAVMNIQSGIIWTPIEYGALLLGVIGGGMCTQLLRTDNSRVVCSQSARASMNTQNRTQYQIQSRRHSYAQSTP